MSIGVNFNKAAKLEPSTFQTPRLSGFWAPQFFVTCNAYYEAVFYGLPNSKMTPNDIHANHCCIAIVTRLWTLQWPDSQKFVTLSLIKTKWDERHFPLFRKPLKAVDIMSLSTHDRSGLSHDIVLPGTVDNSVLSIISVLSFRGIHDGIYNLRFFCMCTSLLQGWMSMTLHSPVRNGWALPAADECSFLTRMYSVGRQS